MKFIAVESGGVTEFINSEDRRLLKLRRDKFNATPRVNKDGEMIEYSEDEIRSILGVKTGGNAAADIFGIKKAKPVEEIGLGDLGDSDL